MNVLDAPMNKGGEALDEHKSMRIIMRRSLHEFKSLLSVFANRVGSGTITISLRAHKYFLLKEI